MAAEGWGKAGDSFGGHRRLRGAGTSMTGTVALVSPGVKGTEAYALHTPVAHACPPCLREEHTEQKRLPRERASTALGTAGPALQRPGPLYRGRTQLL